MRGELDIANTWHQPSERQHAEGPACLRLAGDQPVVAVPQRHGHRSGHCVGESADGLSNWARSRYLRILPSWSRGSASTISSRVG